MQSQCVTAMILKMVMTQVTCAWQDAGPDTHPCCLARLTAVSQSFCVHAML